MVRKSLLWDRDFRSDLPLLDPPHDVTVVGHTAARYAGASEAPPMHWKPCHPATVKRFKAEFACPNGHGIILKGHSIDADGTVHPSVVCPAPACDFHDFVRLSRWDAGPV
jgi:hypothetical protein